jgi:hypothetical protein
MTVWIFVDASKKVVTHFDDEPVKEDCKLQLWPVTFRD